MPENGSKSIIICIESSHQRGMGHLFRAINLFKFLKEHKENIIIAMNNDPVAINILNTNRIPNIIVDPKDVKSHWEFKIIKECRVKYWINDRLDTAYEHAEIVKNANLPLLTFDDRGRGAEFADYSIYGLSFRQESAMKGKSILYGSKYLILNSEIVKYRYQRKKNQNKKIIITMGGSDTYGVTIVLAKLFIRNNIKADIVIGPSFNHEDQLYKIINNTNLFKVHKSVPNLIEHFKNYDLAFTGGGITAFEANASGLPCVIVANEYHEISSAKYLDSIGSSIFAGYYKNINLEKIFSDIDIQFMSEKGLNTLDLNGAERIYNKIRTH